MDEALRIKTIFFTCCAQIKTQSDQKRIAICWSCFFIFFCDSTPHQQIQIERTDRQDESLWREDNREARSNGVVAFVGHGAPARRAELDGHGRRELHERDGGRRRLGSPAWLLPHPSGHPKRAKESTGGNPALPSQPEDPASSDRQEHLSNLQGVRKKG